MRAQLLRAVLTVQVTICPLRKTLRILEERDLPSGQKAEGNDQKAPGISLLHKKERREHHGIIPVVDATGRTTFVFQEPCLEWTEKQDADDVAHRIE